MKEFAARDIGGKNLNNLWCYKISRCERSNVATAACPSSSAGEASTPPDRAQAWNCQFESPSRRAPKKTIAGRPRRASIADTASAWGKQTAPKGTRGAARATARLIARTISMSLARSFVAAFGPRASRPYERKTRSKGSTFNAIRTDASRSQASMTKARSEGGKAKNLIKIRIRDAPEILIGRRRSAPLRQPRATTSTMCPNQNSGNIPARRRPKRLSFGAWLPSYRPTSGPKTW